MDSLQQWLQDAAARLSQAGIDTPRLDAEIIAASLFGVERARLYAKPVELQSATYRQLEALLARRAAREPLAYIVGHKEFFSLEFEVTHEVLIPRPETELVVEAVLEALAGRDEARILELGVGSGAIAIATALNAPNIAVVATDISAGALSVARRNAARHGCEDRLILLEGDLFGPLARMRDTRTGAGPRFDLIVSNPPYIEAGEIEALAPEIVRYEPRLAVVGGQDGMAFYRAIARDAADYLAPEGEIVLEIGAGKAAAVAEIFASAGFTSSRTMKDLAGCERVVRVARGTTPWTR